MQTFIRIKRPIFGGNPVIHLDRKFWKLDPTKQRELIRDVLAQARSIDSAITRKIESGQVDGDAILGPARLATS